MGGKRASHKREEERRLVKIQKKIVVFYQNYSSAMMTPHTHSQLCHSLCNYMHISFLFKWSIFDHFLRELKSIIAVRFKAIVFQITVLVIYGRTDDMLTTVYCNARNAMNGSRRALFMVTNIASKDGVGVVKLFIDQRACLGDCCCVEEK